MIENGSEMYRVEDTMNRIAQNAGEKDVVVFTTPMGLFMGIKNKHYVQLRAIQSRTMNLEKVSRVNSLSREFAQHQINLNQLHHELELVDRNTPVFPFWEQVVAAAIVSCTLMIIFAGEYDWIDMPLCAVVGAIGYAIFYYLNLWSNVRFVSEFMASFILGLAAFVGVHLGLGHNINNIIIGAVMPLVPGVAITNAFRDLLAGHLLTGISRATEAVLSACAIGTGIALIFRFFV